jgi:hypothetical protein
MVLLKSGAVASVQHPGTSELSPKAQQLYDALRSVGTQVGRERGYVSRVSVVHFHIPGEIVARACGMARSTLYVKLRELKAAGVVDARAHYVTYRGRTRADGMVWAVRLAGDASRGISVPFDALKQSYRCLSADVESGRTAWAQLQAPDSQKNFQGKVDIEMLLAWALPPVTTQKPVKSLTVRPDLEAVLDIPHVDKADRGGAVDRAARALSVAFSDPTGVMFYRWLLWQLLRLAQSTGAAPWHMVYEQARRARADAQEGFARRPGALFVSRLKGAPFWDEVMRAPSLRVGTRPLKT